MPHLVNSAPSVPPTLYDKARLALLSLVRCIARWYCRLAFRNLLRAPSEPPGHPSLVLVYLDEIFDWDLAACHDGKWASRAWGEKYPVKFWINLPLRFSIRACLCNPESTQPLADILIEAVASFSGTESYPASRLTPALLLAPQPSGGGNPAGCQFVGVYPGRERPAANSELAAGL